MLILLDIDGVMVSGASWKAPEMMDDGFPSFSQRAISGLKRIIAETGATIVLTSSHKSTYGLSQWKEIFRKRGIDVFVEKLEDNHDRLDRKYEILKWLDDKKTERFVIIDDDKSLNGLPPDVKKKFVLTSSIVGLNDENASSAIEILKAS